MEQQSAELLTSIATLEQDIAAQQSKLRELKQQAGFEAESNEPAEDVTVAGLFREITEKHRQLKALQKQEARREVPDYELLDSNGIPVKLSELFGDKQDLIVIHNMGASCPYCTLWADGFNGVAPHLENRAAFAVVSPDEPEAQRSFAESRGWKFRMYSGKGSAFTEEMGYSYTKHDVTYQLPGFSTFHKMADGTIVRSGADHFGPGDYYSGIWHMFDLLEKGADGWEPQYRYR